MLYISKPCYQYDVEIEPWNFSPAPAIYFGVDHPASGQHRAVLFAKTEENEAALIDLTHSVCTWLMGLPAEMYEKVRIKPRSEPSAIFTINTGLNGTRITGGVPLNTEGGGFDSCEG